ncbi:hypothetical protein A0256_20745 [Mucilaginibacter sp. PAMC 26640]|nr:hypothetical protein A0256_20745 [Mucilaginibacter sp. PAMC 26640]
MDKATVDLFVKCFTLNQRNVNYLFRKEIGLNKTHIEILAFAATLISFNPYNVQKQFVQMNLQQVRQGIRKLVDVGAIELWHVGKRNKPAVYLINNKGRQLLESYIKAWLPVIRPDVF